MEYIPKIEDKEIEDAHAHYKEKLATYKNKGLDFDKYRKFLLDKAAPLENDILEVGAGSGHTTVSLAEKGYNFIAIDIEEEGLRAAAARLAYDKTLSHVTFHIMDAARLEFGDNSFRSIISINMLHHAGEVEKLLSEVDRVLSPEGKVILSDFNEDGQKIIAAVHSEEGGAHDHPVTDPGRIGAFFKKKGYGVEELESVGHWILIAVKK